jgi:hypothetical protein
VNERAQTVAAFDRDRSRVGLRRWRVSAFGRRESQAAVRPMGVVPKPLEFNWHELATTDRRAALDFYGAMFGWETIGENDAGPLGAYLVFGQRGVPYGGIFDKAAGDVANGVVLFRAGGRRARGSQQGPAERGAGHQATR